MVNRLYRCVLCKCCAVVRVNLSNLPQINTNLDHFLPWRALKKNCQFLILTHMLTLLTAIDRQIDKQIDTFDIYNIYRQLERERFILSENSAQRMIHKFAKNVFQYNSPSTPHPSSPRLLLFLRTLVFSIIIVEATIFVRMRELR